MELVQVNWDDRKNLFLKFSKNKEEKNIIRPDTVKKINVKFQISKKSNQDPFHKLPPFLNSIKTLYFSNTNIAFCIELESINNIDNLQINFIGITIFFESGEKNKIMIQKEFPLSEITYSDINYEDFIDNRSYKEVDGKISNRKQLTHKRKIIEVSPQKSKKPAAYNKATIKGQLKDEDERINVSISKSEFEEWKKFKGKKSWTNTMFVARQAYKRLQSVEKDLKKANDAIRQIALKNASALSKPVQFVSPPSQLNPPQNSPSTLYKRSLNDLDASTILSRSKIPENIKKNQAKVIREMKEKFEKMKDLSDILTKVPEDILKREIPRTDQLAYIKFKQTNKDKTLPN